MRACVRACARACVRACVRARCVRVGVRVGGWVGVRVCVFARVRVFCVCARSLCGCVFVCVRVLRAVRVLRECVLCVCVCVLWIVRPTCATRDGSPCAPVRAPIRHARTSTYTHTHTHTQHARHAQHAPHHAQHARAKANPAFQSEELTTRAKAFLPGFRCLQITLHTIANMQKNFDVRFGIAIALAGILMAGFGYSRTCSGNLNSQTTCCVLFLLLCFID